jgi:hypothetical protein
MGSSFTYQRTITLDAKTLASLQSGTAVVVVHGLDPATLPAGAQKEPSDLVPSLPLAATSPALCGTLTAMPAGAPGTGIAAPAQQQGADLALIATGAGLIAAAGGVYGIRRRLAAKA